MLKSEVISGQKFILSLSKNEVLNIMKSLDAAIRYYSKLLDDAKYFSFDDYVKLWEKRILEVNFVFSEIKNQTKLI